MSRLLFLALLEFIGCKQQGIMGYIPGDQISFCDFVNDFFSVIASEVFGLLQVMMKCTPACFSLNRCSSMFECVLRCVDPMALPLVDSES